MNQSKHQRIRSGRDNLATRYQVMSSPLSVQNVEKCSLERLVCLHITDLHTKVSNILVISVIIKLQHRVMSRNIFSLNMKVSSILVISVIIILIIREIFRDIFSLYMKESGILVTNVIIKL